MSDDGIKVIPIKPYMLKEIAEIYGIHRDTMRAWLERIKDQVGERIGYYYNIDQVRTIFKIYKLPSYVQIKDDTRYFD